MSEPGELLKEWALKEKFANDINKNIVNYSAIE